MKKSLSLLLAVLMCISIFSFGVSASAADDTPLVVGYSPFNSKFSPFFAATAYDQDAQSLTQLPLLTSDRTGAVVMNGIEGETIPYNGTDYTYYGPADCVITENDDGTVFYDFTLRDDLVFSDGEPLTADDVIFSMYVLCDPTYDGSSTLYAQPILGMEAYRSGVEARGSVILAAGDAGYEANDLYTKAQYDTFWDYYSNHAGTAFAQEIVDYCIGNGYNAADDSVAACAANWGFALADDATAEDFWAAIVEAYDGDIDAAVATESAGSDLLGLTVAALGEDFQAGVETGDSAARIEGIQKVDNYHFRVVLTKVDATAIYQLTLAVAPLHYYGDPAQYDYANNQFGFPKGDLSLIRAKTTQPLGAGPYKFIKFENGVINYEANEYYFKGEPKTKYLNFLQCTTDDDKLNGVVTGTIDITDPSYSNDTVEAIKAANGNGDVNGSVIVTDTVDNLGYGYIGMNANVLNVGGEPDSAASRALRKAFSTVCRRKSANRLEGMNNSSMPSSSRTSSQM